MHRDCSKATVPGQWYSYAVVKDQGAVFTSEEETVAFVFQLRGGDEVAACPWHKECIAEGEVCGAPGLGDQR